MLKLYDYPQCPFCRKVRIALAEKGLKYERVFVDLRKREQKKEEFLKLNPYGKVPVLIDNGTLMYESSVINEYLDEKYPNPPLMPPGPADRARVRLLVDFCESHFHTPWFNIYLQMTFKAEDKRDKELLEESKEELKEQLRRLDEVLDGQEYLGGGYSLADAAFTPRVGILDSLSIQVPPEFRNVNQWIRRIKARPSYQALEL